ncbi:MAG: glycosyltransferase, partial [Solirubrobacterales bacterium]
MALTEVKIAPVPPERFRSLLGDAGYEDVERAVNTAARVLPGRVIWHINSTPRGGGVAEMLQSLLAYARGAGVDVRWAAVSGNPEFFRITKRLHNRLHGAAGDGGELGGAEREVYEQALVPAAEELGKLVSPEDIVYIHDPQPAPLLEMLRDRGVASVWRCHVGVDEPNELVRRAWDFLRPELNGADALVFSRQRFVWDGLEGHRIWILPPTIDAFSPKNQAMDAETVTSALGTIGLGPDGSLLPPTYQRNDGAPGRINRKATIVQEDRLPAETPLVAQVSRWDRLKDPVGLLVCFAEHVEDQASHLVIAGPDVEAIADDPEGAEGLDEVRVALGRLPDAVRARVHLVSLPMDDFDENAAMVNALQRRADIVVQKS